MTTFQISSPVFTAPVDSFHLLRNKGLTGAALQDSRAIETSLLRFGLLSPLKAICTRGRLIVIDGRKRLAALRRLSFEGRLPSSLNEIPYVLAGSQDAEQESQPSAYLGSEPFYRTVSRLHKAGKDLGEISARLSVSRQTVRHALSLDRLAPPIRRAFFQRLIPFETAQAYATIPSRARQLMLFFRLGLTAEAPTILDEAQDSTALAIAA